MRASLLRRVLLVMGTAAMVFLFTSCGAQSVAKETKYKATFIDLFDTVSQIIGYDTDKDTFQAFADRTKAELAEYHDLYDIYHDDAVTSIKTINDNAGIQAVKVDQRIIDLLLLSRRMYDVTGGKTNIAMGAVLDIWHNYRNAGIDDPVNAELPPMELLQEAAKHTNIDDMIIDEDALTVYLQDPDMSLDVGAIAKGYATERVARSIEESGKTSVLLSIGGNVRAIGEKPGGETWTVGIQNPDLDADTATLFSLDINNLSVVTSGSYQRYYTVDGVRYNHIIDPVTLMPTTYFIGISVVTEDSGFADGLSTALFIMPLEDGRALVESLDGVEACWVSPDGSITMTDGFEALIQK